MNEIDAAIYSTLNGDATLSALATGGVWRIVAPEGTTGCYVVFQLIGSPEDVRVMGSSGATIQRYRYQIKAIMQGTSAVTPRSAISRVEVILDDAALALTPQSLLVCRRAGSIPDMVEPLENEIVYQHVGAEYIVEVQVS
jgi:hypothetical protein